MIIRAICVSTIIVMLLTACGGGGGTTPPPDNGNVLSLDALSVTGGSLDQIFQSNQLAYTATVGFITQSIKVTAPTGNTGVTITVNGVAIGADNTSQSIVLSEGINPAITIVVTAPDSTTTTYTLTVTRQIASSFAQQAYIKASNTDEYDGFGYSVALSGNTLAVGAFGENSMATDINGNQNDNTGSIYEGAGAVYVFTRTGFTWSQQAYIKASNTDENDWFGYSVALYEDTLVVGALQEDSSATGVNGDQTDNSADGSGAVYIFTRSGVNWTQQSYIKASNTGAGDFFGSSVALSGDTIAVGADSAFGSGEGAVYVYTHNGVTWSQQAYIKASNSDTGDTFGYSVALEGNTLAVGARYEDSDATGVNGDQADNSVTDSGAVYIFMRSGTTWAQQAYLKASNTGFLDFFGFSVALSGDTLAVGAVWEDSAATGINGDQMDDSAFSSGAVYIFTRSDNTWSQQAYIKASNTDGGVGGIQGDLFGDDVALSGDTLVVGASSEGSAATGVNGDQSDNSASAGGGAGAVYVFTRDGATWTQQIYIKASNSGASDFFGEKVAISGDTIAVATQWESSAATGINGDQTDNSAVSTGAVYVFE